MCQTLYVFTGKPKRHFFFYYLLLAQPNSKHFISRLGSAFTTPVDTSHLREVWAKELSVTVSDELWEVLLCTPKDKDSLISVCVEEPRVLCMCLCCTAHSLFLSIFVWTGHSQKQDVCQTSWWLYSNAVGLLYIVVRQLYISATSGICSAVLKLSVA